MAVRLRRRPLGGNRRRGSTRSDGAEPGVLLADSPGPRDTSGRGRRLHRGTAGSAAAAGDGCQQVQVDRFVTSVLGYWFAQVWEATNRADTVWPTVEEYKAMRVHTGAVPTCLALIDVVGRFELPAAELARPEVKALTTKAVNVVCWANDIHSYEKESTRSHHPVNLPTLLHRRDRGTVQEAVDHAAKMHDAEVAAYRELRPRVPAGPALERYLDGLQSWMRGNLTWSLSTGRYHRTPIHDVGTA
ncbi:terpene synthase family protein [Streptomyces sp. NPDC055036]